MEPCKQRRGDAPRAFDLVGRGGDLRPELAGAGDRVRTGLDVHARPRIGRLLRPTARALSIVSQATVPEPSSRGLGRRAKGWAPLADWPRPEARRAAARSGRPGPGNGTAC